MNSDIIYYDAIKLAELIRTREVSPVEVVQAHLDRIEAINPKLNAIVTIADDALEAAKAAEAAVLVGKELGPLHGVPITAKDSIDTAGVLTQRGSPIFKGRVPKTDATSVARLKRWCDPACEDESSRILLLDRDGQPLDWKGEQPLGSRSHARWV
jgi:aspartyl-tRNA(Asn)/glutamyl-tRNA(Gln) amidotransferase subunit A